MNRLQKIFTGKATPLIVADVCGAPDMVQSEKRIQTLIDNSVDIVNLIVPFSDPMADGAAVQSAAQQALANGADLEKVLQMIARIRQHNPGAGLIVSGYYNWKSTVFLSATCPTKNAAKSPTSVVRAK